MKLLVLAAAVLALDPVPAAAHDGGTLYAQHCSSCHGAAGEGTRDGPSLRGTPSVYVHFMLDTGRMPAPQSWANTVHKTPLFDARDIDEIVDYVATLSPHGVVNRARPVVAPGDVSRGRTLYAENCQQCHGAAGNGASVGYDMVAPSLHEASALQVAEAIRSGPEAMPRFGSDVLSDRDVDDIVAYVGYAKSDTMPNALDAGGFALAHIGPVAEGIIAWVFGLGALLVFVRKIGTVR